MNLFLSIFGIFITLGHVASQNTVFLEYSGVYGPPGNNTDYPIAVVPPPNFESEGPFPVFMWIPNSFDEWWVGINQAVGQSMASRGFLSAFPDYNNYDFCLGNPCDRGYCSWSLVQDLGEFRYFDDASITNYEKAKSLLNALDVVCDHPLADCSLGVALVGHGQGGYLATLMAQLDARVTALTQLGIGFPAYARPYYGGNDGVWECFLDEEVSPRLSRDRRLYIIGENDPMSDRYVDEFDAFNDAGASDLEAAPKFSGYECFADGDDAPVNCTDFIYGSGYYIVGESDYSQADELLVEEAGTEVAASNIGWNTAYIGEETLPLPSFVASPATEPWQLGSILDFSARTATRGLARLSAADDYDDDYYYYSKSDKKKKGKKRRRTTEKKRKRKADKEGSPRGKQGLKGRRKT